MANDLVTSICEIREQKRIELERLKAQEERRAAEKHKQWEIDNAKAIEMHKPMEAFFRELYNIPFYEEYEGTKVVSYNKVKYDPEKYSHCGRRDDRFEPKLCHFWHRVRVLTWTNGYKVMCDSLPSKQFTDIEEAKKCVLSYIADIKDWLTIPEVIELEKKNAHRLSKSYKRLSKNEG